MNRDELQAVVDRGMAELDLMNRNERAFVSSMEKLAAIDPVMAKLIEPASHYLKTLTDEKRRILVAALRPAREVLEGPFQ